MRLGYALIVLSLINGCSPSKQIGSNVSDIARISQSSKDRFNTIQEEVLKTEHIDVLLIRDQAKAGSNEQQKIMDLVFDTMEVLPFIDDEAPWWGSTLEYGFIALAIVGTFALLWYLGLGIPIKALMRSFAAFIPRGKRDAAKLMREAQDPNSKTSIEEAIAVLRATDKDFDAAYRKEKK